MWVESGESSKRVYLKRGVAGPGSGAGADLPIRRACLLPGRPLSFREPEVQTRDTFLELGRGLAVVGSMVTHQVVHAASPKQKHMFGRFQADEGEQSTDFCLGVFEVGLIVSDERVPALKSCK
jgi:hypothetical protein